MPLKMADIGGDQLWHIRQSVAGNLDMAEVPLLGRGGRSRFEGDEIS